MTKLFLIVFFVSTVALLMVPALAGGGDVFVITLLLISTVILMTAWCKLIWAERPAPVYFFTLVYLVLGLVVPALYQAPTATFFWPSSATDMGLIRQAGVLFLLSSIAFLVGHGSLKTLKPPKRPAVAQAADVGAREEVAVLVMAVAAVLFAVYTVEKQGLATFFSPREEAGRLLTAQMSSLAETGLTFLATRGYAVGALVVTLAVWTRRPGSLLVWIALGLLLATNAVVNFPLSLPRSEMAAIVLSCLLVVLPGSLKYIYRMSCLMPVVVYLIFPMVAQINRKSNFNFNITIPTLQNTMVFGDFDGFQSLVNAVMYVQQRGIHFGMNVLSALLFFIPRTFWTQKEQPAGLMAGLNAGYKFLTVAMPLPGEFYVDFGLFGAIVGMYLTGRGVKWLDLNFEAKSASDRTNPVFLVAVFIAVYATVLMRGSLLGVIKSPAVDCGAVMLFWLLSRGPRVAFTVQRTLQGSSGRFGGPGGYQPGGYGTRARRATEPAGPAE